MNNKIAFPELIDMLSEINGTSRKISETFLKELFNVLREAFENGESVKIKNLGVFKVVKTESRKSIDINTGKEIEIPEHNRITFTPDKEVADAVNKSFAGFETVELDNDISEEEINKLSETDEEPGNTPVGENTQVTEVENQETEEFPKTPESESEPEQIQNEEKVVHPDETPVETEPEQPKEPIAKTEVEPKVEPKLPDSEVAGTQEEVTDAEKVTEEPESEEDVEPEDTPQPEQEETESSVHEASDENTDAYIDDYYSDKQKKYKKKFRKGFFWGTVSGVIVTAVIFTAISYFAGFPIAMTEKEDVDAIPEAIQDPNVTVSDNGNTVAVDSIEVAIVEKPEVVTDTVRSNKFLTTMAREYYGNFNFWVYIYEENKAKIKNPDRINKGTVVVIPPAEKYGIDKNDPESVRRAEKKAREITNKFNN